jgi:dihydroorotate dehydrogenase
MKWLFRIPGMHRLVRILCRKEHPALHRNVFGIDFPNPVGLAAGLDKNARLVDAFSSLGFGFIEIGTVTPLPQPGNEKPRMFRLPDDRAIINRMGFNNDGAVIVARRLRKKAPGVIVGGNIGKNKDTAGDKATGDYESCFRELFSCVDYFAVNVSSPNTPGLRTLQDKEPLLALLTRLHQVNAELAASRGVAPRPILLKIAPDLSRGQLDEVIDVVIATGTKGVIATNTTIARDHLVSPAGVIQSAGSGGLSGKPLFEKSTEVIRYLHSKSAGRFSIVGVGGIHSPEDALEKLNAGAELIQLYTGFIYEGPALIRKINKALLRANLPV